MKLLVNFYANVSEQTVNNLITFVTQNLAQQDLNNPFDELILQISSSGGSSDHGLLAYNYLKQLSIKKTTIGMGNVDSAAVMLYCAGSNRLAMPSCRFVLHEARATINGEFNSIKLKEIAKLTERISNDYSDVIATVTTKAKNLIRKKVRSGTVISSDEAKKIGLVNLVNEDPYIKDMKDLAILMINNPPIISQQQGNLPQPLQPQNNRAVI